MATVEGVGRVGFLSRHRIGAGTALPTLLLIIVAVLTITPVVTALVAGFRDAPPGRPGAISVESVQASFAVMMQPEVWTILWTTVWLSTVRAVLALALAVLLAWIIARTDCPFRNQLEFLLIISFFFPLLGKVLGWALLLSPQKGYLNQLLRLLPFFGVLPVYYFFHVSKIQIDSSGYYRLTANWNVILANLWKFSARLTNQFIKQRQVNEKLHRATGDRQRWNSDVPGSCTKAGSPAFYK